MRDTWRRCDRAVCAPVINQKKSPDQGMAGAQQVKAFPGSRGI
jgi:hypothetical protein